MYFKCIKKDPLVTWFTVGMVYKGELVVSPEELTGKNLIYIYETDDGFPAYADRFLFATWRSESNLSV